MFGNNQTSPAQDMNPVERHDALSQLLDEIKRYVAGTYSKVDTEIDDIRKVVDRLDDQVRGINNALSKLDQIERTVRNIESTVKEVERKIR